MKNIGQNDPQSAKRKLPEQQSDLSIDKKKVKSSHSGSSSPISRQKETDRFASIHQLPEELRQAIISQIVLESPKKVDARPTITALSAVSHHWRESVAVNSDAAKSLVKNVIETYMSRSVFLVSEQMRNLIDRAQVIEWSAPGGVNQYDVMRLKVLLDLAAKPEQIHLGGIDAGSFQYLIKEGCFSEKTFETLKSLDLSSVPLEKGQIEFLIHGFCEAQKRLNEQGSNLPLVNLSLKGQVAARTSGYEKKVDLASLRQLAALEEISLSNVGLQDIDISNVLSGKKLNSFCANSNSLTDVGLSDLLLAIGPGLKELQLEENSIGGEVSQIHRVNFEQSPQLNVLSLSGNFGVNTSWFDSAKLQSCRELQSLNVVGTAFGQVSVPANFKAFANLERLATESLSSSGDVLGDFSAEQLAFAEDMKKRFGDPAGEYSAMLTAKDRALLDAQSLRSLKVLWVEKFGGLNQHWPLILSIPNLRTYASQCDIFSESMQKEIAASGKYRLPSNILIRASPRETSRSNERFVELLFQQCKEANINFRVISESEWRLDALEQIGGCV